MPLLRSLCATYAIFTSTIWQSAIAAPGMSRFGGSASHPYLDPSGYALDAGRNRDWGYSQGLPNRMTFLEDQHLSPQEKSFLGLFHDWHYQIGRAARPLGLDNQEHWQGFAEHREEIMSDKPLLAWLKAKGIQESQQLENSASGFEFMLKRATSREPIWWESGQLEQWQKAGYDWMAMIEVGDVLEFDNLNLSFMDNATFKMKKKQLKALIQNGDWHPSMGYQKQDGAKGWLEFQTLYMFKDEQGNSMLDRIKPLFPDHLPRRILPDEEPARRKPEDVYILGSPISEPGPGRASLAWAPAPEPNGHVVVRFPPRHAPDHQHQSWLQAWLNLLGNRETQH